MPWFQSRDPNKANRTPQTRNRNQRNRNQRLGVGCFETLESRHMMSVTFHGGQLLSHVEAQPVFLGSDWATNATLTSQATSLNQFNNYIVKSPYMDMLTQAGYNVGQGTETAGQTLNVSLNKTSGITDAQIHSALQSAITSGQLGAPDANRLYVVYVEPGVVIKDGSATSATSFLGYHGAFAGRDSTGQAADIRYAVMAYPGTPNPSAGSQGFNSNFDQLTAVTTHELAEAVTDPDVNYKGIGWYDDQLNGEIGDLTRINTTLNGYVVQDVVDKNDNPIAPVVGTSGGGSSGGGSTGGTGTTSLTAPQNVLISALDPTDAQLSWKLVTGAAGYTIFQVNGNTTTNLGSVSATTSSVKITGLTAGKSASFMVEAYKGNTVADSVVVTVQLPAQPPVQTLSAPQVTAAAISSSVVQLNWNNVAGATGYNIYWWNGFQAVLLGTVNASTHSIQITGLRAGKLQQFVVEAFNATAVADSAWISVTTPGRTGLPWWW